MKTGRSLQDWAKEIERRANAKRDFMVDTRSMEMFNGEQGPQVSLELQDSRLQLGMTENAHRQIGTHLNIPAKYYELMRKENPELLVQNVNSWLEKNPTRRLVRALDGDMRAFLSDRYRCIDNLDIAECVLPIISKMPDATIESCEVTDDRMYIKVVNPRIQAEVVPGDIVQSGMLISNSEVGLGGVVVQPLIYRLVCTNGMVVNAAGEKRRHIGRIQNFSENRELFRDETLKANACFLCGDGHLAAYRADILAVMRFQLRGIVDISHADDVLNRHKFCQSQFIIREGRGRNSKGFRCPLSAG